MTTAPKSKASLFFPTEGQRRLLKTSNTEKLNGVLLQIAFQGEKKTKVPENHKNAMICTKFAWLMMRFVLEM